MIAWILAFLCFPCLHLDALITKRCRSYCLFIDGSPRRSRENQCVYVSERTFLSIGEMSMLEAVASLPYAHVGTGAPFLQTLHTSASESIIGCYRDSTRGSLPAGD